jgi:hypothetical protein
MKSTRVVMFALFVLLACGAGLHAQVRVPTPTWFEGQQVTEGALSGIWWVKFPLRFVEDGDGLVVSREAIPWTPTYVTFDKGGIIRQSGVARGEPRTAVGVWMLVDGTLSLTISDMTIDLQAYVVQNDKILVAGICRLDGQKIPVAGMLLRMRESDAMEMMQE